MNLKKHLKNIILSAGMVAFQIFQPQTKPPKKVEEEIEEESDISEEDKKNFIANAIEYNPATKYILHQYYTLFDVKQNHEIYVSGIFGKRIPLKNIQRKYFTKVNKVKRTK